MKFRYLILIAFVFIGSACTPNPEATIQQEVIVTEETPLENPTPILPNPAAIIGVYYTHPTAQGNHYLAGQLDIGNIDPIRISLAGTPQWVVGAPLADGNNIWVVALEDGLTQAFIVADGQVTEVSIPQILAPNEPPAIVTTMDGFYLLQETLADNSELSNPILTQNNQLAYISTANTVEIQQTNNLLSLAINPLEDGRVIEASTGELIVLSEPTTSYGHSILGDETESFRISIIDISNDVIQHITIPAGLVIEGIYPILADLDGDQVQEIIVTQSGNGLGAQLAVYNFDGTLQATSSFIGKSYRWRHQIAVAPFGPNGEIELVDVQIPHINGQVEFFQLHGDELQIQASVPGYTSHISGTRNLDIALAGNFDSDPQIELLVPNQTRNALARIQRTPEGAEVEGIIELGGVVITNFASFLDANNSIQLAIGLDTNELLIWQP